MTPQTKRLLTLVALVVPRERRERWVAEWSADLDSCEELGMSKRALLASFAGAALSLRWTTATSDAAAAWAGVDRIRLLVIGVLLPGFAAMLVIVAMNANQPPPGVTEPPKSTKTTYIIDPATGAIIGTE